MNTRIRKVWCGAAVAVILPCLSLLWAQQGKVVWTEEEQPIVDTIKNLRSMGDAKRAEATKRLALSIRELPAGDHKGMLAESLVGLATEGDPGRDALQEVATTLTVTLWEQPVKGKTGARAGLCHAGGIGAVRACEGVD